MKYKSYLNFSEVEKMSWETMRTFLALCLMEEAGEVVPDKFKEDIHFKIMSVRLATFAKDVKVTDYCILFLASISKTPAELVIWAYTIADIFYNYKGGKMTVTMGDLAERFPIGFPTQEAYFKCWEDQKIKGGNAFDMPESWFVSNITNMEKDNGK